MSCTSKQQNFGKGTFPCEFVGCSIVSLVSIFFDVRSHITVETKYFAYLKIDIMQVSKVN